MIEIKGEYNTAKVFTDNLEPSSEGLIKALVNKKFCEGSKIRIMPDVHAGKGCVVGMTMTIKDKICPNFVGSDIGCGVTVIKILEKSISLLTCPVKKLIDLLLASGICI